MTDYPYGANFSNGGANGIVTADGFSGPGETAAMFPNGISGGTPISGAVSATTLTASSTVTLSPASKNVTISPTGTGTVTIDPAGALTMAPTAAGTLDNVVIGGVTALAGTFTALASTSGTLNGTLGGSTPAAASVTTLAASSTVSGAGFSTYLASPPAIGATAPAAGKFTTLTTTGLNTLTGGLTLLSVATPAAAGSTVSDATQLTATLNAVTGADGTKGVKLPATPVAGTVVVVKNNAGSTLKVWPDAAATINAIGSNADLPVLTNAACLLFATSTTQWWSVPLVPS